MLNILIDKKAVQDLIFGDKGKNIGHAHAGLHITVKKLVKEDLMPVIKTFFNIK